jgi:hypothetical protein
MSAPDRPPPATPEEAVQRMAAAAAAADLDAFCAAVTQKSAAVVRQMLALFEAMSAQFDASFGPGSVTETRGPIGDLLRVEILGTARRPDGAAEVKIRAFRLPAQDDPEKKERIEEETLLVFQERGGWFVEPPQVKDVPPEVPAELEKQGGADLGKQLADGMAQMMSGLAEGAKGMVEGIGQAMGEALASPARPASSEEWPVPRGQAPAGAAESTTELPAVGKPGGPADDWSGKPGKSDGKLNPAAGKSNGKPKPAAEKTDGKPRKGK